MITRKIDGENMLFFDGDTKALSMCPTLDEEEGTVKVEVEGDIRRELSTMFQDELASFLSAGIDVETNFEKVTYIQQIINVFPQVTGQITDVLILLIGGSLVIRGQLTMGMLVAFNSMFDSFCTPINELIGFFSKLQVLKSNINRVEDIEKYPQEAFVGSESENEEPTQKLSGTIEIRNVSFGYSRLKPPLIEDFSINVRCGDSVAFVGPSGCGKSTISKIVSGLYRAWDGQILLDNIEIDNIPHSVLTSSIATVSQNIMLFTGTVRDNLTMWSDANPV